MPRLLPLLILLLASCRPPAYVQPTEMQPHAILKIRHVVHARSGPLYDSGIRIGRFSVDERTLDDAQLADGSTIHLRIHPTADAFSIGGTSYHLETRRVLQYRTVQEPYSCSQQQCSGGYGTSRSCHTVHRTCYRSRQQSYWTNQTVRVVDDTCAQGFPLAPRVGAVYLMQFDYLGGNQCQLACFEQVPTPDGQFQLLPCEAAVLAPPSR